MIRTETPEWVGIDAKVKTSLDKLGIPGTDAGMGIIITVGGGLEKLLFLRISLVDIDGAIGKDEKILERLVVKVSG
jgi:hypothetical protein